MSGFSPPTTSSSGLNYSSSSASYDRPLVNDAVSSARVYAGPATVVSSRARVRRDSPFMQEGRIVRRDSDSSEEEQHTNSRDRTPRGFKSRKS